MPGEVTEKLQYNLSISISAALKTCLYILSKDLVIGSDSRFLEWLI